MYVYVYTHYNVHQKNLDYVVFSAITDANRFTEK